ncbi:pimeloyl-ACP methyl ester carboxylesterase [Nocardioides marinisabuli]|uniref:Pimeloyl-ACP methyl ester carboxylesterase n=1 Tax=Nocardioides marinisabuli TaxID=419476 RepID=A0A7Y9F116_9ACTN|nr:alpha/beta hydrolase [Nocardioides marinisabuli]NYD57558.1 pimeloyl-ACP methyl ester carboxylesterase [Nocardioides marinisabuli]
MTTITVPASEPEIREPEGSPAGADQLAERLFTAVGRYDEVATEAGHLQSLQGWWGEAYDAYRGAASRAGDEHDAMATTLRRVARAVTAYADDLRAHQGVADDLVSRKGELDADRSGLVADINAITDATPQDVEVLRARAADLRLAYRRLVEDHADLQRAVRENEQRLRQAFEAGTSLRDALSATGGASDTAVEAMNRPGAPGSGASPSEVQRWWAGLSEAQQQAALAAYPSLLGQADGLPASVRDEANRLLLDDDLATLAAQRDDDTLSPEEAQRLANAEATQEALTDADGFEDPTTGERPGGRLWLYDPGAFDGDGRVAVAIGDLDTAADVAVSIPGITTETTDVAVGVSDAINLYEATRFNGDGSSVATMFWLGYDTPEGAIDLDTITRGRAEDGGERLADAIDGLRASRPGEAAHLTVIGHSYGSTTTSYAATDHALAVDDVALIGSPGAGPADTADDLSPGEGNVWVGRNSRDAVGFFGDEGWWHNPGGLGVDPSSEDFDANRFEAESVLRSDHRSFADHSRYYDHDSESLYNLGRIVDGQHDAVNAGDQTYDPWWRWADDPEGEREPSTWVPGRSETRAEP